VNFASPEDARHDLPVASILNLVFLLFLFLLVAYSLREVERAFAVNLPVTTAAPAATDFRNQIVVNVAADGTLIVNRQTLTPDALFNRLERLSSLFPGDPPVVVLRADESCKYRQLVAVLNLCAKTRVRSILMQTRGEESPYGSNR
jgi:biopolymer transport protein ExbD